LRGEDLTTLVALCHACHGKIDQDATGQNATDGMTKERVVAELVARKEMLRAGNR